MAGFEVSTAFEGTPAELFGLATNAELLDAWEKAIGRIEESERAAAAEDAVICGNSSH